MIKDFFLKLFHYKDLTDTEKVDARICEYALSFLEKVGNLYTIKCNDIVTKDYFILIYAFLNGHCGMCKVDNKYYVGMGSYIDNGKGLDKDGFPREYMITFQNGETFTGEIGKDIVVFKWNNLATSQAGMLGRYAYMLADTDTSMVCNIKFTRVCPIPIVSNDLEEKSMATVVEKLFNGEMKIFKRSSYKDIFGNNTQQKDTLDLTRPQDSQYLQHLSRFHDELIIRLCLEMGVYVSSRDKGAQLNERELNAFADYCAISSDDTKCRLDDFAKDCKDVFGIDVEIKAKEFIYTEENVKQNEQVNVSRETSESEE